MCLRAGYTPYPALAARLTRRNYDPIRLLDPGSSLWGTVPFRDRIAVVFSILPFGVVRAILRYVTSCRPSFRLYSFGDDFTQLIIALTPEPGGPRSCRPGVYGALAAGYCGKFRGGDDDLSKMAALSYDYRHLTPETAVDYADRCVSFLNTVGRSAFCSKLGFWQSWAGYGSYLFRQSTTVPGISEYFGRGSRVAVDKGEEE